MRKKFATLLLSFALLFTCFLSFTACDKGEDNNANPEEPKATVSSIAVELTTNEYTLIDDTITVLYGRIVYLYPSDFKVTATMSNNTTVEIREKTDTTDGYTFSSTIPDGGITPSGEYLITFSHDQIVQTININVCVNKANVDMSYATWDYTTPFTYNGQEKYVEVINLPEGVSVEYRTKLASSDGEGESGNSAVNAGDYITTAIFTYADEDNYNPIPSMDIPWRINKADVSFDSYIALKNYTYDGNEKEAMLDENSFLPEGVEVTFAGDTEKTNAGSYSVTINFAYNGEDKDNYNPIPSRTETWEIYKASLTVTANSKSWTYGSFGDDGVTFDGFKGDDENALAETIRMGLTMKIGKIVNENFVEQTTGKFTVGEYVIRPFGLDNLENYTTYYYDGRMTITPKRLNISLKSNANEKEFTYGDTISYTESDLECDGFVYGENISTLGDVKFVYNTSDSAGFSETAPKNVREIYYVRVDDFSSDNASNYIIVITSGTFKINKASLSLSVNSKTNEGATADESQLHALTYDGNSKDYTSNDVVANGLKYNDQLSDIRITFEYLECDLEIVEANDWAWNFTDIEGATWRTYAPANAGAYKVRVKEISSTNYTLSTSTEGKMYIKKAPIRINIGDHAEEYTVSKNDLSDPIFGGEAFYHVGYDGYSVEGDHQGDYHGYQYTENATVSNIDELFNFAFNYDIGHYEDDPEGEEGEQIFVEYRSDNYGQIPIGEGYVVRFDDDTWERIENRINLSNYELLVVEGTLNVTKKMVEFNGRNSHWLIRDDDNNDERITNTEYDEDLQANVFVATIENKSLTISFWSDVSCLSFSTNNGLQRDEFTITNSDGNTVNSITTAGEYVIKQTLYIEGTHIDRFELVGAEENSDGKMVVTVILKLTVFDNYFGTRTEADESGEGQKTVSINFTTTDDEGNQDVQSLTFNEFINQTEFKEGDTVSFSLKDDPAVSGSGTSGSGDEDEDEEELNSQVISSPFKRIIRTNTANKGNFLGYQVTYNGIIIEPDPVSGLYTITIAQGEGLIIEKVYADTEGGTPIHESIFTKSNFRVIRLLPIGGEDPNEDILNTITIGDKIYSDDQEIATAYVYYKLSETQTQLTATIDENYVGQGYYLTLSGNSTFYYFDEANTLTIPVNLSALAADYLTLSFNHNADTVRIIYVIAWSEVATIDITYQHITWHNSQEKTTVYNNVFMDNISGAIGWGSLNEPNRFVTNIGVTFEEGYEDGWTYAVKEKDNVTDADFTIPFSNKTAREFHVLIYKNGTLKYTQEISFTYDIGFDDVIYVIGNTFDAEIQNVNSDIQITSQVRKTGDTEYSDSITLDQEVTSVDFKITMVYDNKTYIYTRTSVVIKQDSSFNRQWVQSNYQEGFDINNENPEFNGLLTTNVMYGEYYNLVSSESYDVSSYDSGLLDFNNFKQYYYDASADDKGVSKWTLNINDFFSSKISVTNKEYVIKNGLIFIKFTLIDKTTSETGVETYVYFRICFNGLFDNDISCKYSWIDFSFEATEVTPDDNDTISIETGKELGIELTNYYATCVWKDSNGNIVSTDTYYLFTKPGTYTLTITSTDESNSKEITIVVTGDEIPTLEVKFEGTDGDITYNFEMDMTSGQISEDSDFKQSIMITNSGYGYVFYTYAGSSHGLKLTTNNGKNYVTLTSLRSVLLSSNALYDIEGNLLSLDDGASLEVLTDENGSQYVVFYGQLTQNEYTINYYIKVYLCENIADLELTFDGSTSASSQDKKLILEYVGGCGMGNLELTDNSDFEIVSSYGSTILMAFVGSEDHGFNIQSDDNGSYITLKSLITGTGAFSGVYGYEGEGESTNMVEVTTPCKIYLQAIPVDGGDDLNIAVFSTMMFCDGGYENAMIYICFFDESDMPEGTFGGENNY